MSDQYAVIQNAQVINVVVWDGTPFTPAKDAEFDDDGNIVEEAQPAKGWSPPDGTSAVKLDSDSAVSIGWAYDGSTFTAPPAPPAPVLTADQIKAQNLSTRAVLLAQAANAIAPLQDAADLGVATDAESASLKAWKQYRVDLIRVDLTIQDPPWPTAPQD